MKKIYLVLSFSGTWLSRVIKAYTRKEFSHVSISLDEGLGEMYSFGRVNAYNPFIGGFVHESIDKGTFKRFKNTKSKIYSYIISDEQYDSLKKIIERIKEKNYSYNFIGVLGVPFKIRVRRKKHFYCAEFVKYLFDEAKIEANLPEIIKPEDFCNLKNSEVVYAGFLRNYKRIS